MALILRNEKGSKLTVAEMDGNLTYLEGRGFPFTGTASIDGALNINFTDSMDFFTGGEVINNGEAYIPFVGWVPIQSSGEGIGSRLVKDEHEFYQFVSEAEAELQGLGLTFPGEQANSFLLIKSGTYSGSVMTNGLVYVDQSGLGGDAQYQNQMYGFFVDTDTDERNSYSIAQLVNSDGNGLFIGKTNNDGEAIDLAITDTSTGFEIYNDLSDDTASLFKVLDNNGDAVIEMRNNGVFASTLNIDFTDTLDFISSDDLSIGFGAIYLTAINDWAEINIDGDTLGQRINTPNDTLILNGVNDVTASLVGLGASFPVRAGGTILRVDSGDYTGSVLRIAASETDQTGIGGSLGRSLSFQGDFIDNLGERNQFSTELGVASSDPYWNIARKINDAGEEVAFDTNTNTTGFIIQNDLSDNEASLLDIRDNSNDTIFEVRNDGLFVGPNIPTADPLVAGQIWSNNGVLTISAGTP